MGPALITAKRVAKVISGGFVRRRIEEVLFEKRLNKAALMRGPKLLDEASLMVRQNAAKYSELDILVEEGTLRVVGYTETSVNSAGLGSGYRYCKLGDALFDQEGGVNPSVQFPDLAAHVFFCETGSPIPKRADGASSLIGTFQGRAIYLLFTAQAMGFASESAGNVLTLAALSNLSSPSPDFAGPRVVYAEGCTVPEERLQAAGVTFKQVPYQIEGL